MELKFDRRIKHERKNGIFTGSSAVAYAWFVWIKGHHDLPQIEWI